MDENIRVCRGLAEYCRGRPVMTFDRESADRWIARADALDSLLSRYERMEKALREIAATDGQQPQNYYGDWVTYHNRVAAIARAALSPEEK